MSTPVIPSPDPTQGKPPRRKRWIPVSLRMFAGILLLAAAVEVLWIGIPAYRQYVALTGIERLSDVEIEFRRTGPDWLRQWVGSKRMRPFDKIVGVTIQGVVTDADLACLAEFKNLQSLQISGRLNRRPKITDAGLVHLQGLSKLQRLLIDAPITDEGLKCLGVLTNLTSLDLRRTQVTEAGLVHLKDLSNLKQLAVLKDLSEFNYLDVWHTAVTNAGITKWKAARARDAWPVHVTGIDDQDRRVGQNAGSAVGGSRLSTDGGASASPADDHSF